MNGANEVQNRLEQSASKRLGFNPGDLPTDYRTLLRVIGWDISNLYGQLDSSNSRILDSMVRRTRSPADNRARPAWGVGWAQPAGNEPVLAPRHTFMTDQKIYFSPVFPTKLFPGKMVMQVSSAGLWKWSGADKGTRHTLTPQCEIPQPVQWLGIHIDTRIDSLNDISFYIDWPNIDPESKLRLHKLVNFLTWETEGHKMLARPGFYPDKELELPDFPDEEYFLRRSVEEEILHNVRNHFFTISSDSQQPLLRKKYPDDFRRFFSDEDLTEVFTEPLVWIKICFPPGFSFFEVSDTNLFLNAFPVLNRRIETGKDFIAHEELQIAKLTDFNRQLPGEWGEEFFVCLQNVWSNDRRSYSPVAFSAFDPDLVPPGTYALQYGNIEAWERGDAWQKVTFLLQELKEQSSGFSLVEREELGRILSTLESSMKSLQKRLESYHGSPNYYLQVKACQPGEHIFLEHWMTQGQRVNESAHRYTSLKGEGTPVLDGRMLLLSDPSSGRNPQI